jgi:zinc protease
MARPARWVRLLLACAAIAGCNARAPLPKPEFPLTASPDDDSRRRPPGPTSSQPGWAPIAVHERTFDNGLRALVVERDAIPMASVVYVNRRAGRNPDGFPADVAMLTGDAISQAFFTESGEELWGPKVAGRSLQVLTGPLETSLSVSVMSDQVGAALRLLSRTVRSPVLSHDAVEAAKRSQSDTLYDLSRTARGLLRPLMMELVFGPEHRWAIDNRVWARELAGLGQRHAMHYYEAVYQPDHSSLIVVGDVRAADVFSQIDALLGSWRPARYTVPAPAPTRVPPSKRRVFVVLDGGTVTDVSVIHSIPGAKHPDAHTLGVLHYLLAGGFGSELMTSLRHTQGLSYSLKGGVRLFQDGGYIEISVTVPNWHTGRAAREILERIEASREQPFSRERVEAAKVAYLARLYPWHNEQLAFQLAEYETLGLTAAELDATVKRVQSLTPADLQRAAWENLSAEHASVLALGNFYEFDDVFHSLGDARLLAPRGANDQ